MFRLSNISLLRILLSCLMLIAAGVREGGAVQESGIIKSSLTRNGRLKNHAPIVNAGPDQTIALPTAASLGAIVTDDGLPVGSTLTSSWSKFSGPGTVTFSTANAPKTRASFSAAGTYVLRLTASDGAASATDDISITVNPTTPMNQAPAVDAGTNQTVTLPSAASINGTATDDGLPNGTLITTWTQVSGPGLVTFANPNALSTTASFSISGTYLLRLTASDTQISAVSDVTIVVNAAVVSSSTPFKGTVLPIPGTIQAEDFDNGGEGVAYHDLTTGNASGNNSYRVTDVDIKPSIDIAGGYQIGYIQPTEWLAYTVNVAQTGTYVIQARVAGLYTGIFHIEFNGSDKTGPITIPNTGGYDAFQIVNSSGVFLTAGQQIMKVVMDSSPGGYLGDIDSFTVTSASPSPSATPTPVPTISVFMASPNSVSSGGSSNLSWTTTDATSLYLDQGIGAVTSTASKTVFPTQTTTYTLTASNASGSVSAQTMVFVSGSQPPSGSVVVNPGDSIQALVSAHAAGTTYYIRAGTYRMQSISPKAGDTYVGETGAILTGSKLITSFTRSGSYWVASGQTQGPTIDANGGASCMGDSALCLHQNEFFIDDVKLKPVGSLAAVTVGSYYFDYAADNIYFLQDPAGHKVEASVTTYAFNNTGDNITIKNLIVEKYANPSGSGAVSPNNSSAGWVLDGNEIRLNHGAGIRISTNAQVRRNYIHHNGQIGIIGLGTGIVVDGNEISFNNDAGYDYGWEAGGTKFLYTKNLVIRNNYSHDNRGPGLWTDYDNYYATFESNRVVRNKDFGISQELCMDGTVRYNYVEGTSSDFHPTRLWNNGAIGVIDTRRAHVYGNTLVNNAAGIVGVRSTRTATMPNSNGEVSGLTDMDIHDNLVIQPSNIAAGAVDSNDPFIYTSDRNLYTKNIYKIGNLSGVFYQWPGVMTRDTWKGSGQDTAGIWIAPTDTSFPSTKFDTGTRVQTTMSTDVRSLPSTVDGLILGVVPPASVGTVTKVRGPIYTGGSWWWQVHYDSGLEGWSLENSLATAP